MNNEILNSNYFDCREVHGCNSSCPCGTICPLDSVIPFTGKDYYSSIKRRECARVAKKKAKKIESILYNRVCETPRSKKVRRKSAYQKCHKASRKIHNRKKKNLLSQKS